MGEAMASHDWLEGVSFVVGLLFLVLAGACGWGLLTAIASWGDADAAFRPGGHQTTVGFLRVTRGFGIVLFALFGFLAAGVGWFLAGDRIRRLVRRGSGA
jgi:hypothetical protein